MRLDEHAKTAIEAIDVTYSRYGKVLSCRPYTCGGVRLDKLQNDHPYPANKDEVEQKPTPGKQSPAPKSVELQGRPGLASRVLPRSTTHPATARGGKTGQGST